MSEMWKQWAGRIVDGRFPLESYLGGSDHSAVFLTALIAGSDGSGGSERAAIKLIAADPATREKQLALWNAARELSHPNLIRIFEAGPCVLDGREMLYVVEEYAEENLSQILPERALTPEEAREMLPSVLRALQFVHDKEFVHRHIHPANIFAIGDEVKLASDALDVSGQDMPGQASPEESPEVSRGAEPDGPYNPPEAATGKVSAAGDVWQVGMMLIEVLTQRLPVWDRASSVAAEIPAALRAPFQEIATQSLQMDADKRPTIAEILKRLELSEPVVPSLSLQSSLERAQASSLNTSSLKTTTAKTKTEQITSTSPPSFSGPPKASAKWPYWVGLAGAVAVVFALVARPKPSGPAEGPSTVSQPAVSESSQPAQDLAQQPETETKSSQKTSGQKTSAAGSESGIVRRVMPEVSPSARRTIHGTIKVRVKVSVDAAGNVTQAKLESGRVSKYFSRIALDAARDWKFSPMQGGGPSYRKWNLQFAFSRTKTEASVLAR